MKVLKLVCQPGGEVGKMEFTWIPGRLVSVLRHSYVKLFGLSLNMRELGRNAKAIKSFVQQGSLWSKIKERNGGSLRIARCAMDVVTPWRILTRKS